MNRITYDRNTKHQYNEAIISMNSIQNNNFQPSNTSISHNINSNTQRDFHNKYVVFLYNEAKRLSNQTFSLSEIHQFIETNEGQKGLKAFIVMNKLKSPKNAPRKIGEVL